MRPIERISDLAPLKDNDWSWYKKQGIDASMLNMNAVVRLYWGYTDEDGTGQHAEMLARCPSLWPLLTYSQQTRSSTGSLSQELFLTHIMPDGTFTHKHVLVTERDELQNLPQQFTLAILSMTKEGMFEVLLPHKNGPRRL